MIEFKGVTKVYPNGVKALNDINLSIDKGEFLVIIGLSGAGKSTLLRLINQLIPVSSGQITVDGVRMDTARGRILRGMRRKIGMIFQGFNIVKRMSVLSNVLNGRVGYHPMWRNLLGIYPEKDKQIAYSALQRVEILEKVHTRASELSGGQQQRVAIARALSQEPLLMLADEPVASLDPITTVQVMDFLKQICEKDGITTIANLHHVDLAWKYATRVVGVRAGEIVYDKRPSETTKKQFIQDMETVYGRPIQHDEFVMEDA